MTSSAQTATQQLPFDLITNLFKFLFETGENIVDIIFEIIKDVGKNKELRSLVSSLVDMYLENTAETLNLLNSVANFVESAKNSQHIIRVAVKQFEAESEDTDVGGRKKKYAKTLEVLNKFEATGDPLGEEFAAHYKSVANRQVKLLEVLCEQRLNLDKKLKNAEKLKNWSYVVLGGVASVLVALAMISPGGPQIGQMARTQLAIASPRMQTSRVWIDEMLNKYEKTVKTYKHLLTSTETSTKYNNGATETINSQVDKLRGRISDILEHVDFALEREEEEEATRLVMQDIMRNVEGFTEKIEEVGEYAAEFTKKIVSTRAQVFEHLKNSMWEK